MYDLIIESILMLGPSYSSYEALALGISLGAAILLQQEINEHNIFPLKYSNGEIKRIWERFGTHGEEWQHTEIDIELKPPHTVIIFEAEAFDWKYGDIAVDDITFLNHDCKGIIRFL